MIKNQWYAILPSKAVKPTGICAVKRLNLDLALFRTSDGKLGCVVDQCTHRGAALSLGIVTHDHIQCPFHGLQFDRDGSCCFIPANGKSSLDDLSRYRVQSYAVQEAHGIIYLWYGEATQASGELPFFDEQLNGSYSEFADHWSAHYSRCIENQLDVVHLPFVHHDTIGRGGKTVVNGPKVEIMGNTLRTSANNEVDNGQIPKKAAECEIRSTYLHFAFPNVWLNHISDRIKVFIYFAPVDDENTILYIRFYHNLTPFKAVNSLIAWLGKFANKKIERQDRRVVVTQRPKSSSLRSQEKLVAGDGPIVAYRRIRARLMHETEVLKPSQQA